MEGRERHDRLGHGAVAAGAPDVVEPPADELARVARVTEIADRDHEVRVDDAGDDRPLHALELQQEVGHVGHEVLADRPPDVRGEDLLLQPARLDGAGDRLEPLQRDLRAFHLAHQRGIGQRVEEGEGLEVGAVGVAGEEQRVGLDRVEHRGGRPLGDVHVDGPQMLGQDGGGRSEVRPDVLEGRRVAGAFRVVVDDQVHPVQQPAEVVGLHVDGRDAVELRERFRGQRLDLDVEEVGHAQVLGAGHAAEGSDDGGRLGAVEKIAEREAAGEGVRIGVVVEEDQHPVRVREVALVLLHAGAGERAAQRVVQRSLDEVAQRERGDLGELLRPLGGGLRDREHVGQTRSRVGHRPQHPAHSAPAVVVDDDARRGIDVGVDVGGEAAGIGPDGGNAGVAQASGERAILDYERDVEGRRQCLVEGLDDQIVLADHHALHESP